MPSPSSRSIDRSATFAPGRIGIEVHAMRCVWRFRPIAPDLRARCHNSPRRCEARRVTRWRPCPAFPPEWRGDAIVSLARCSCTTQSSSYISAFRRVQILRLVLGRKRATAERDDLSRFVVDGNIRRLRKRSKGCRLTLPHQSASSISTIEIRAFEETHQRGHAMEYPRPNCSTFSGARPRLAI